MRENLAVGVLRLDDALDAFALECAQQAGGDDDGFAGDQLRLDFVHDGRIKLRAFGQQNQIGVRREFGMQVNGNAEVAKIIVEKILAGGLIRFVARDANGFAQLAEKLVRLFQRISRDAPPRRRGESVRQF